MRTPHSGWCGLRRLWSSQHSLLNATLELKVAMEVLNEAVKLRGERGITVVLIERDAKRALERGGNVVLFIGGASTLTPLSTTFGGATT